MLDSGGSLSKRHASVQSVDLVQVIALDQYHVQHGEDRPDLVKIDVEYHEIEVIRGAATTFASMRPKLLVEVSKQNTLDEVVHTLHKASYSVFSVDDARLTLHEHIAGAPVGGVAYASLEDVHNLIACPDRASAEACRDVAANLRADWGC